MNISPQLMSDTVSLVKNLLYIIWKTIIIRRYGSDCEIWNGSTCLNDADRVIGSFFVTLPLCFAVVWREWLVSLPALTPNVLPLTPYSFLPSSALALVSGTRKNSS